MYYDTTGEAAPALAEYRKKAARQADAILDYFRQRPGQLRTPSEVWVRLYNRAVPITSVRRAMSDLTEQRLLEKTDSKRTGPYGRAEYCWRLSRPVQGVLLL